MTGEPAQLGRAENRLRWLRVGVGCAVLAGLGGCSTAPVPPPFERLSGAPALSFLNPHGPVAAAQRAHFMEVFLLLLIVVVPVLVLTPIFAWRYRYGGSARYTPRWAFSWPLEFAIWGVPIAIVAVLAIWLWRSTKALDPYAPIAASATPLRVEVIGYDWKWLFIYPQFNVASIGAFAFPAGRPLAIDLTSGTVMQSFFIPALGSQIYAMPGMVTKLHLLAGAPGTFRGENTQFNGKGFYEEDFTANAMTAAGFRAWVKRAQSTGIPMSGKTLGIIRERSTLSDMDSALGVGQRGAGPLLFRAVSPGLFDDVLRSVASR